MQIIMSPSPDDDVEHQPKQVTSSHEARAEKADDVAKAAKRSRTLVIGGLLFVCLIGIGAVIILLVRAAPFRDNSANAAAATPMTPTAPDVPDTMPPSTSPVEKPVASPTLPDAVPLPTLPPGTVPPTANTYGALLIAYIEANSGLDLQDDPTSPDILAAQFLIEENAEIDYTPELLQRFALLTLDFSLKGSNGSSIFGLTGTRAGLNDTVTDECLWPGVVCSNGTGVTELHLPSLALDGTIPVTISLLTDLTHIDLSNNALVGSIPESLYTLTQLKSIYLYKNMLQGTLSNGVGNLQNLRNLWLNENSMTGPFPSTLRSTDTYFPPIEYLNLYKNSFTGTIPNDMRLRSMFLMDLGYNNFVGTLPTSLERFYALRHLSLDHNDLSGTIPSVFPNIGNGRLETLNLNDNRLTGIVPGYFQLYDKLVSYTLTNNQLSGMDQEACRLSVMQGGENVEFDVDCAICSCNDFMCWKCFN